MFFTPKWKKEAKLLAKGALKFLHYKRDLLKPDRIDEIVSRRTDLLDAIKASDRAKSDEASKQLRATCENALPSETAVNWFEENVEVMFVAIVIALGLRAYYLQPFRIPTGSMMPTLNGIIGTKAPDTKWSGLPTRIVEQVLRGRSYVKIVNDRDRQVRFISKKLPNGATSETPAIADYQRFHFFSRSLLEFVDSEPLSLPAPTTPMMEIGLREALQKAHANGDIIKKGEIIAEGYIDSGDLVLVDKFSYHFRKPKRGEVFVFDTIDIRGIHQAAGDQAAGSHYIKRLCGVPGDVLSVATPNLLNHGQILQEPGIQRVIQAQGEYGRLNPTGYVLASPGYPNSSLSMPSQTLELAAKARLGQREYAAFGDNTGNSLDSRYWGSVKEFNLVGPALFSLWPFTTGHWGFIR
jgi:signal peptidase I